MGDLRGPAVHPVAPQAAKVHEATLSPQAGQRALPPPGHPPHVEVCVQQRPLDPLSRLRARLGPFVGARSEFDFYAALRRIESLYRAWPRLGEAMSPSREPVRFGQDPTLAFEPAAVTSLSRAEPPGGVRVGIGFFGVFGPNGPLPTHLTQYALDRQRHGGDSTLIGFLDMFQQRMVSLLFRSWAQAQPTVQAERPLEDRFAHRFGALVGQGNRPISASASPLDQLVRYTAVHFAPTVRHPEGFAKVLRAGFGVEARIEEFLGQWMPIPERYAWHLPAGAQACDAPFGVLGVSTRVGSETWERTGKFRVVLGPLTATEHARFLPGTEGLSQVIEVVQRYAGPEQVWDLQLVLREPDRRPILLGVAGVVGYTAQLGDPDQVVVGAFEDLVIDPAHQVFV